MKYEEAHRHADTLFPRDLWELAETALAPIRAACKSKAVAVGAEARTNLSAKHPHPACILTKRLGRVSVSVEIYAEPATDGLQYQLGVRRSTRSFSRSGGGNLTSAVRRS
jgi:hypothetical protein